MHGRGTLCPYNLFQNQSQSNGDAERDSRQRPTTVHTDRLEPPTVDSRGGKPGRPRSQAARESVLRVARRVALEVNSYREFSLGNIAKEAKVSKATVYRWWPTKVDLLTEACQASAYLLPSSGSLAGDLRALVRQEHQMQRSLASRPVFAGAWADIVEINAQAQAPEERFQCRAVPERQQVLQKIFENAALRGEWKGTFRVDAAYTALISGVFLLFVGQGTPVGTQDVAHIADCVALAARDRPPDAS